MRFVSFPFTCRHFDYLLDSFSMQRAATDHAVYTIDEAARVMKISRNYLYLMIKKKQGPPVKRFGNRIRIPVIAFNDWLNKPAKK